MRPEESLALLFLVKANPRVVVVTQPEHHLAHQRRWTFLRGERLAEELRERINALGIEATG